MKSRFSGMGPVVRRRPGTLEKNRPAAHGREACGGLAVSGDHSKAGRRCRRFLPLLVPVLVLGFCLAACTGGGDGKPSSASSTDGAVLSADSPLARVTCKANRATIQHAAALFFATNKRMPSGTGEMEKRGMFDKKLFCPSGGTYSIDSKGLVSCSVHGR